MPLLDHECAVKPPSHDGLIPNTPTICSQLSTIVETRRLDSSGNDEPSSLKTGQLQGSEMGDEGLGHVNDVEPSVVEKETGGDGDAEVVNEFNGDDELEDDEDELDEEDVPSEDEAPLVEGDDMDLDIASSSLSHAEILSSLSRFNVSVEPVYHLSICTECAIPIRLQHMYMHQKTKHFKSLTLPPELSFPSRAELESLLATLGADQPLEVPDGPIPRIQGVQIIQGLKCTTSGCSGKVFGAVEGRSRNLRVHQLQVHPQVALADRRSIQVPCQPLSANRRDRRFVEIKPTSASTSVSSRLIEKAAETCSLLEHEQVFTIASNEREKNAVFAQSRWDEVVNGVNLTLLMATISSSKRDVFVSFKRLKLIARELLSSEQR
ncbi:hypothetical protein C8R41DRAFT_923093 [Lentinula lateritia]|uniref:C2H2-type domain-containing protein n=1 Tax=Lentinula lateritia TaxID=40482 RepID=A0ABQ8V706_9AGAR|nr:hypothetical protein C8R41DRAFT_923093 [Lentinula lateritia]